MFAKRTVVAILAAIAAVVAAVGSASAAQPTFERIAIDDTFADSFLTAECGVPVTTHATGHIVARSFDASAKGVVAVNTVNVALTATSGDNSYRFRDVGADVVRISPDGAEILMVIGQLPFEFTGVLKVNLTTDEVILEPQHVTEGDLAEACAALSA